MKLTKAMLDYKTTIQYNFFEYQNYGHYRASSQPNGV